MNRKRLLVASAMVAALPACTQGPDYKPQSAGELAVPETYVGQIAGSEATDISSWWTQFDDPVLISLVEQATAGNLDIAQAMARVEQAQASLKQSRGAVLPQIDASGSSGRNINNQAPDNSSFSQSVNARWTLDLFGGQKRSVEAAQASYQAAGFSLGNAQALVAAEVARNYVDLRSLQDRLLIARASLETQDQNVRIAGWRAEAGLVSAIDVEQAKTQRAQTAASLPLLMQAETQARYRLAVITGQAPGALDDLLKEVASVPSVPPQIGLGIPTDILRQRPDVRAAERDLAAQTARIGVSKAQLYPSLSLTGSLNTTAASPGTLGDLITGGLFANIAQVIFDGGQLKAAVLGRAPPARAASTPPPTSRCGAPWAHPTPRPPNATGP
ncbi:MAG: efflux transporter outer membrane subunit, partial [Sphingomonadaceae bacterium]|nr:efflux transporter outer membrane subunit [Sphingomonadaceae bacterium]